MTLPAFAEVHELADRIPGGISKDDDPRAQAALDEASALIRVEAGLDWASTDGQSVDFGTLARGMQDAITMVCLSAARRAFENPEALESQTQTLGDATESRTWANASNDVYLTSAEKALIRRAAGKRSVGTISTTREDRVGLSDLGYIDPIFGNVYAEVDPPGQPIPWLDSSYDLA